MSTIKSPRAATIALFELFDLCIIESDELVWETRNVLVEQPFLEVFGGDRHHVTVSSEFQDKRSIYLSEQRLQGDIHPA